MFLEGLEKTAATQKWAIKKTLGGLAQRAHVPGFLLKKDFKKVDNLIEANHHIKDLPRHARQNFALNTRKTNKLTKGHPLRAISSLFGMHKMLKKVY
jgi:hypothetical protein